MSEQIDNYLVFSSNASKKGSQKASITVRSTSGEIVARIYSERSQPLKWLRRWPHCLERAELVQQLRKANVQPHTIEKIVRSERI